MQALICFNLLVACIGGIPAVLTRRRERTIGSQTQGAEENAPPVLSDDSSAGGVGLRLVDSNSENTTTTTSSTNPVTAAQLGANSVQTQVISNTI